MLGLIRPMSSACPALGDLGPPESVRAWSCHSRGAGAASPCLREVRSPSRRAGRREVWASRRIRLHLMRIGLHLGFRRIRLHLMRLCCALYRASWAAAPALGPGLCLPWREVEHKRRRSTPAGVTRRQRHNSSRRLIWHVAARLLNQAGGMIAGPMMPPAWSPGSST